MDAEYRKALAIVYSGAYGASDILDMNYRRKRGEDAVKTFIALCDDLDKEAKQMDVFRSESFG